VIDTTPKSAPRISNPRGAFDFSGLLAFPKLYGKTAKGVTISVL